ncbi:uncharacterized protein LOC132278088 [Cornus florida]|uniref:uncharacterized protein LOC132278088 n=1 Tax=Cornus florida TaxID=4283 RepID=UPI0028A27A90|nr:uncharacterized protein LOC132278088 [Cornus florida]
MASVSPEESKATTNSPIDEMFDLDIALTMEDNSSIHHEKIKVPKSNSLPSHDMPTVSAPGVCTICMEGFESGKQVPCGHLFHPTCIANWVSLPTSCPLCRFNVSGDRNISSAVSLSR